MFPNAKPSELIAVLATIDPVSQAAGAVSTGWVPVKNTIALMALIQTGVLGASATVDAKIQQASDSSGTGAKDVSGKSITQILKASGDNKQAIINFRPQDLDTANSFTHVRLTVTVGTATSLVAASLMAVAPRYEPADALNQAGVVQTV